MLVAFACGNMPFNNGSVHIGTVVAVSHVREKATRLLSAPFHGANTSVRKFQSTYRYKFCLLSLLV